MDTSLTKIIATIGPAVERDEIITKLIEGGVSVFRFNLKHNDLAWHRTHIQRVKEIAERLDKPVGVLIDLQGPEIRLSTPHDEEMALYDGQHISITKHQSPETFHLSDAIVFDSLDEGVELTVDDGRFLFTVVERTEDAVILVSHSDGVLRTRKTLNIPGVYCPLAALTEHDLEALRTFADLAIDFIALSFVRTAQDVQNLKDTMKDLSFTARVISKVETKLAIDNIDEIIDSSEGIMVARGDLGVEISLEQVPHYQKIIIRKCLERGFPVITATQMIHSMVERPYPTRAEISDIANAAYDLTDMVMLSEETAAGAYPLQAVSAMKKTVKFTEMHIATEDARRLFSFHIVDTEEMLCDTAYNMYLQFQKQELPFGGFIVFTETGRTARKLSRYRAKAPIYVFAPTKRARDSLTVNYGVIPFVQPTVFKKGKRIRIEDMQNAIDYLRELHLFDDEKSYILLYGDNWMVEGRVSTIKVISPKE